MPDLNIRYPSFDVRLVDDHQMRMGKMLLGQELQEPAQAVHQLPQPLEGKSCGRENPKAHRTDHVEFLRSPIAKRHRGRIEPFESESVQQGISRYLERLEADDCIGLVSDASIEALLTEPSRAAWQSELHAAAAQILAPRPERDSRGLDLGGHHGTVAFSAGGGEAVEQGRLLVPSLESGENYGVAQQAGGGQRTFQAHGRAGIVEVQDAGNRRFLTLTG